MSPPLGQSGPRDRCPLLDQSGPRDLRVPLRTNLNTAVGDTDPIPPGPELRVLASVGEADVSGSGAVVLEHVGYLEDTGRSVRSRLCASRASGSYLMPLLIAPLLKVDLSGGEGLHGVAFPVQQLDADLVLAATVPARRVPKDKGLRSPSTGAARHGRTHQSDTLMSGWRASIRDGLYPSSAKSMS